MIFVTGDGKFDFVHQILSVLILRQHFGVVTVHCSMQLLPTKPLTTNSNLTINHSLKEDQPTTKR